jgi:hypothetical protein
MLSISDTGPGIDGLIKDRIFEPFFTTREQGSAGMGLSVVYGIVKAHHAAITVGSAPGRGRLSPSISGSYRGVRFRAPGRIRRGLEGEAAILFVDDEEALVEMGRHMLERLGYEVVAEKDSLRALNCFQRDPETFDLVITDQTMPNMTASSLRGGSCRSGRTSRSFSARASARRYRRRRPRPWASASSS